MDIDALVNIGSITYTNDSCSSCESLGIGLDSTSYNMCRVSCNAIVPGTGSLSGCYYQLDSGFTALQDCEDFGSTTPVTFDVFIYCDNDGDTKIKAGLGYSGGAFGYGDTWEGDFVLGGTSTLTLTSSDGFSGACTPPSTIEIGDTGTCISTPADCTGCGDGGGGGSPLTMRPVPLDAKTGQPLSFIV